MNDLVPFKCIVDIKGAEIIMATTANQVSKLAVFSNKQNNFAVILRLLRLNVGKAMIARYEQQNKIIQFQDRRVN